MTDFDDKKPDGPLTPEQEAQAHLLTPEQEAQAHLLTPEQEAQAHLLTPAQLQRIDECLLSHVSHQFRKVAYVIGQMMKEIYGEFPGLPDVFYGLRIKHLAQSGVIEGAGNLNRMRYSEIRLPDEKPLGLH